MALSKPHIVLIIARGEAVRNFLYSETLGILHQGARITLLSALDDEDFRSRFQSQLDEIIELKESKESKWVGAIRELIAYAHYRWLWSEKVKNKWKILDSQACTPLKKIRHAVWKALIFCLANRLMLSILAGIERRLTFWLIPTHEFDQLFTRLKPDLVFNTSHIHAPLGELPVRVAHKMGIPTATFIFSWDNLSSRGRILPYYDHYLVWHEGMRKELLRIYPSIPPGSVHITGTPQFDYHFKKQYLLTRKELCTSLGLDADRPFILYTTGMDSDFPGEVSHIESIIRILQDFEETCRPQLVVRTYVKGTSEEIKSLSKKNIPGVVFPPILWEKRWLTPQEADLSLYTSLLHHCVLGINPASTVSLELLMLNKPVINLGFNPPGHEIQPGFDWKRHIEFDHYRRVVESGAVTVARSVDDIRQAIHCALSAPAALRENRQAFISRTFGETLDGLSGRRVAEVLLETAK